MAQETTPVPPDNTAATIAAREESEERYKRMAADLQAVQSDNQDLHAKITALEQELQTLRDAQAKPVDNSAIQDSLKQLAEKIAEVDKKRLEDKDAISEEIRKSISGLDKIMTGAPPPPTHESHSSHSSPSTPADTATDTGTPVKGYSYTIADGDRLDLIVRAYNKEYKSKGLKPITMRQAKEANPKVDWNRLRVGQKIIVPRPDGG
jgi:hypothetical protein